MENFNSTLTSLEDMSYATGMGNDTIDYMYFENLDYIQYVINMVTLCIELPVLCWAVFALFRQVKADNTTPVYVINLLISDFIQIIGRLMVLHLNFNFNFNYSVMFAGYVLFVTGLVASILFMMCIALERYLLVVHPLWYRFRHTIKHSILISLAVYVCDLLLFIAGYFSAQANSIEGIIIGYVTFLLLPLPLLVFFLGATWRALSHCISVPRKEKKRILATLALVLLTYLVLFVPSILVHIFLIQRLFEWNNNHFRIHFVAMVFLCISPLMDTILYILIKKDAKYTLKVPHCCRRLCTHKESGETSTVPTEMVTSV